MEKEWIISDTHFYHEAIIKYENRPFENADEMNKSIILNWNKRIKNNHNVFILGDFALANKEKVAEIASKLNGNKFLIMGNHDSHSTSFYKNCGFKEVSKYPIIIHDFYILSHQPIMLNPNMPYVNIHGHTHSTIMECISSGKNLYFNACVENHGHAPIDFNTIKEYYNEPNIE